MRAPYKRATQVNAGSGHVNEGRDPGEGKGMVTRNYGKSAPSSPSPAKPMGVSGGSKSAGNVNTQGERAGGMHSGRSRTNAGRNRIGSGRQQTVRG